MNARYGIMAEYADANALLAAAGKAQADGWMVEAYAPFAVEGLAEALGFQEKSIAPCTLAGGIVGGLGGYGLQWYAAVYDYPINIGGRPLHSWPAFMPIAFELTILGAALATVLTLLWQNGLPRLRHPIFDAPDFDLASRNRFFLVLLDRPGTDLQLAHDWLAGTAPLRIAEVAP